VVNLRVLLGFFDKKLYFCCSFLGVYVIPNFICNTIKTSILLDEENSLFRSFTTDSDIV